jgi:hypothetical protein
MTSLRGRLEVYTSGGFNRSRHPARHGPTLMTPTMKGGLGFFRTIIDVRRCQRAHARTRAPRRLPAPSWKASRGQCLCLIAFLTSPLTGAPPPSMWACRRSAPPQPQPRASRRFPQRPAPCAPPPQVPEDAHTLDLVFQDSPGGQGFRDDNGGLDYHIPVTGGRGAAPNLKVVHVAVEMAPIAKVGGGAGGPARGCVGCCLMGLWRG